MASKLPLIRIPASTTIHRLGSGSLTPASALLRFGQKGWTIFPSAAEGAVGTPSSSVEGWAIVGDSEGRRLAVQTLLGRYRIHPPPPPPGAFPYISTLQSVSHRSSTSTTAPPFGSSAPDIDTIDSLTPRKLVRHLAFARPPSSGEFTDFTARYGALQEEDALTFRETLLALHPAPTAAEIDAVAQTMRISHLLDLPSVSFSSGQTRRGRIAAALLTRPVLLILEDPMAGLDVSSRAEVSGVLGDLNERGGIRVVLVLRAKGAEGVPEWVSHVAEVQKGEVWIGAKEDWLARQAQAQQVGIDAGESGRVISGDQGVPMCPEGKPLVELNGVAVSYGEGTREVLKGIDWTIREGEQWHLQGANGSGKTTLLSIILGHHPRSFSLPTASLRLFSRPRREIPTPILRTKIGHTSPEIYAAFPRGMGLSAAETVGTGFEGVFSRRTLSAEQKARVKQLLQFFSAELAPSASSRQPVRGEGREVSVHAIGKRLFAQFATPQQALLLFLRALVARAPLVILDEPSQGVDEAMWARCRLLLEQERRERPEMSVVVVSHYEDEVPWGKGEGRVLKLVDGKATVE